jgi:hypothetical protein
MIARLWSGSAGAETADAYEERLQAHVHPASGSRAKNPSQK